MLYLGAFFEAWSRCLFGGLGSGGVAKGLRFFVLGKGVIF